MPASTTQTDDTIPSNYLYSWSPGATLSIEEFTAKYKPSMVQNDGHKPWIWVRREDSVSPSIENQAAAIIEAGALLGQITERVEEIKNDDSIPVRGNKKAGTQSKKEVREQVQGGASDKLKEISKKHGYVGGKWLVFAPSDKVDIIWRNLAISLVSGPLSSTSAFCAKVATSPNNAAPGHQHVICIYVPDVYDKEDVTAVMKVLLRQHGLNLSGVKSDLYTTIGLDSKHPSGIPSTVWKNVSLLKETEIKELKEAFYAELSASKATFVAANQPKDHNQAGRKKTLVKKRAAEDPFASDEDVTPGEKRKGQEDGSNGSGNKAKKKKLT